MWFPNDEMDVNKFRLVHIPPKSHYLQKFGFTSAPSSQYTGDEAAPMPMNKIEQIAQAEALNYMMLQEESKSQSND